MNLKLALITFISLCFVLNNYAQLSIVKAKGGDGINVNWADIKEKEEAQDGPGFFHHDCNQGVSPEHASSTLKGQGTKNYSIKNLSDDDPMTAWVEGKIGYGIGEWFEVQAIKVNQIYNGYQSTPKNWKDNSRVKRFKVYANGDEICYLDLLDEMGAQYFELPHRTNWEHKVNFKFEIVEVYKGEKWDDVCISHLDHAACCFASTTLIRLDNVETQRIDQIGNSAEVLCLNLETEQTFSSKIEATTMQRHLSLLEVSTKSHNIAITPDHPLYVKGKGFVSLSMLFSKMSENKSWVDIGMSGIEVMVYDEATDKVYYEEIQTVKKVTGDFDTYTVLSIDKSTTYIANGFINKTY